MIEHHGGASRRASVVHALALVTVRPTASLFPMRGPLTLLYPMVDVLLFPMPRVRGTAVKTVHRHHWRAERLTPAGGPTSPGAILYLHGGAFLTCGLRSHRRIASMLAARTGMTVLNVEYRMYPKARYAQMVEDCLAALDYLVEEEGFNPATVVAAGDSAGGNLAFATALAAHRRGQRLAGIISISAWLDFDHTPKLTHPNRYRDALIPAGRLRRAAQRVTGSRTVDLSLSPVNADLDGMPPVLLFASDREVLLCDSELMHDRLVDAGVPAELHVYERQVHAFPVLSDLLPEANDAVDKMVRFSAAVVPDTEVTAVDVA